MHRKVHCINAQSQDSRGEEWNNRLTLSKRRRVVYTQSKSSVVVYLSQVIGCSALIRPSIRRNQSKDAKYRTTDSPQTDVVSRYHWLPILHPLNRGPWNSMSNAPQLHILTHLSHDRLQSYLHLRFN